MQKVESLSSKRIKLIFTINTTVSIYAMSVETFISSVESDIASHKPSKHKHDDLTKSERSALYDLQNRQEIIIKPADKGSAVVVMDTDTDHYISEAERQLGDSTDYKLLDHDPTPEFAQKVSEAINEMHDEGHISEKNRNYLLIDQPKAGRFYLLPKIHKAGNPGRPIVSANGHPMEKISEFVDLHLQPHVQNLPSYLKDTTDFLRKQNAQAPYSPSRWYPGMRGSLGGKKSQGPTYTESGETSDPHTQMQ